MTIKDIVPLCLKPKPHVCAPRVRLLSTVLHLALKHLRVRPHPPPTCARVDGEDRWHQHTGLDPAMRPARTLQNTKTLTEHFCPRQRGLPEHRHIPGTYVCVYVYIERILYTETYHLRLTCTMRLQQKLQQLAVGIKYTTGHVALL